MYEKRIYHEGLKAFRIVKHTDPALVEFRANLQMSAWDERWRKVQEAEAKMRIRSRAAYDVDQCKRNAAERTNEIRKAMDALARTLHDSLEVDHRVDWESMKNHTDFPTDRPVPPAERVMIPRPVANDPKFVPILKFADKVIPSFKREKVAAARERYLNAERGWLQMKEQVDAENSRNRATYQQELARWEANQAEYQLQQRLSNEDIDARREQYLRRDASALSEYWELVLSNSEYPDSFPKSFVVDYLVESQTLIVEYALPAISCLPQVKEVKYVQARGEYQDVLVSAAWLNKTYDDLLYQMALRTIYELFQSDTANALQSVVFNGWVNSIDKATGAEVNACLLSVQASKDEFLALNLQQVEPRACFKKLKGISAARLTEMTPVKPVLQLNREDKRFISSYAVADSLDSSYNLAAMDWADFENLIREVFEKEFTKDGGEVKITQASRDGGVDAVAFDPDPIRGGKIVIQAKRYTNTVGVSAVRDLYGTVLNEGANKGILVTTADFGRDSFDFAKDKPLTLLSGSELLYLLAKHGHKAKIDLQEARRLAAEA